MPSTLFRALIGHNWTEALEIAAGLLGVEPGWDRGEVAKWRKNGADKCNLQESTSEAFQ